MRKNKNTSKIIAAGVVALITMILSYAYLNNINKELQEKQQVIDIMQQTNSQSGDSSQETYAYAVAADNLKAGEMVTDIDVDFKSFDVKQAGAFENRSDVVNKVLLSDIQSGDVFTNQHIAKISADGLNVKQGFRALTLPADTFQGKSNKMVLGSSVDIYSADSQNGWIMEDVKIIGLEGADKEQKSQDLDISSAKAITFEVASGEISDFITNASGGKLVLVARSANEKRAVHKIKKAIAKKSSSSSGSFASLPNLPASPPIGNLSGLPQPTAPTVSADSVELIEANVKSKVTFE